MASVWKIVDGMTACKAKTELRLPRGHNVRKLNQCLLRSVFSHTTACIDLMKHSILKRHGTETVWIPDPLAQATDGSMQKLKRQKTVHVGRYPGTLSDI